MNSSPIEYAKVLLMGCGPIACIMVLLVLVLATILGLSAIALIEIGV